MRMIRELFLDLINGFKAARRQRKMIEAARAQLAHRLTIRPRVVSVGTITEKPFAIHADWFWDCPIEWIATGPTYGIDIDGVWRAFGYSEAELREIHARRAEFVDSERA